MRKSTALFVLVLLEAAAAIFFSACNRDEIAKLQEQAAVLTKENYDLKSKIASIDRELKAQAEHVNKLALEREQCARELQAAKINCADRRQKRKKPAPSGKAAVKRR
jgi:Tfp pilus assembly protein PilN